MPTNTGSPRPEVESSSGFDTGIAALPASPRASLSNAPYRLEYVARTVGNSS
jgi:hypothetical protein